MYTVVLMTALSAGGNAPEFFFRSHGCHGGCYRGCYSGCYSGYGCYGCTGCYSGYGCSSYHGCYSGCYSGCYGGGCYGHWGYGHACFSAYQCHGCYGCSGWNGCYGCYGCYSPQPSAEVVPGTPAIPGGEGEGKDGKKKDNQTGSVRSTVTIEMPEDAKLYVDGVLMKTRSAKRVFVTPELPAGRMYFYDLKAELEREGQPITITGRVVITPGQAVSASLSEPTPNGTFVVQN